MTFLKELLGLEEFFLSPVKTLSLGQRMRADLAAASAAFWIKDSIGLVRVVYEVSNFVKYPINIYPKAVRFIMSGIVPFAFTGYFPAAYIMGKGSFNMGVIVTFLVSIISIVVAYSIWCTGIKRYESAGN